MKYNEIEGNLITLALEGKFQVIAQGNNCFCVQGAGLAPQMVKAFYTDTYPMEHQDYKGDINKLGTIDWKEFRSGLFVVNAYTQYGFGRNYENGIAIPLDYEALTLCMRKINHIFKGKHIGLPLIGCGLGGAIWDISTATQEQLDNHSAAFLEAQRDVKTIIQEELKDCDVTVVYLPQKLNNG